MQRTAEMYSIQAYIVKFLLIVSFYLELTSYTKSEIRIGTFTRGSSTSFFDISDGHKTEIRYLLRAKILSHLTEDKVSQEVGFKSTQVQTGLQTVPTLHLSLCTWGKKLDFGVDYEIS
jgi:hypothetical protein